MVRNYISVKKRKLGKVKVKAKSPTTLWREEQQAAGGLVRQDNGEPLKAARPKPRIGEHGILRVGKPAPKTKKWQDKFIKSLRTTHSIKDAVSAAGITRAWAYQNKAADPDFRQRWIDAWEAAIDELEAEAHRRAMDGSDMLMMFMLNGNRRQKYQPKGATEESKGGQVISFSINIARISDNDSSGPDLSPEDPQVDDVYEPEYRDITAE